MLQLVELAPTLDTPALMTTLAAVRPLFHSEADFQYSLVPKTGVTHADAKTQITATVH
jgi:hypothetical protein